MELLIIWLACTIGATMIASSRGESSFGGFVLGAILGPIGVLLALSYGKRCEYCQSKINKQATTCPKCGKDQTGQTNDDVNQPPEKERPKVGELKTGEFSSASKGPPVKWILLGALLIIIYLVAKEGIENPRYSTEQNSSLNVDSSPQKQAQRAILIDDLISQGIIIKTEKRAKYPHVFVTKKFNSLTFDQKHDFISVILAYYRAQDPNVGIVGIYDQSRRMIGQMDKYGLSFK